MKTTILTTLAVFFIVTSACSQVNLNEYKYILVKKQFSFLKNENEYRLNSLAKFLFNKYGFTTFMEGDAYPSDFFDDRCSALKADIIEEKGLFKTKLKTVLINCNDQVIYTSNVGESREKEFKKAYNEAVRNSFKSIEKLNYKYTPNNNQVTATKKTVIKNEVAKKEIEELKEEIQMLKKQKEDNAIKNVEPKLNSIETVTKEVIRVDNDLVTTPNTTSLKTVYSALYAQETSTGYQLVDSFPKVVFKLKNTGLNNMFIVEGKDAIVYKKDDSWVIEYYENNSLKQDVLNIKF